MKVDFSNLFSNSNIDKSEFELLKQLINSKNLVFENHKLAIFLSVYCLSCMDLIPELKKEENRITRNGGLLIFDSTSEEMKNIISHFNLKIPTISTDLDFFVNELKINKTPSLMAWDNKGSKTNVEIRSILNISDISIYLD